jgi:hypothetical protein
VAVGGRAQRRWEVGGDRLRLQRRVVVSNSEEVKGATDAAMARRCNGRRLSIGDGKKWGNFLARALPYLLFFFQWASTDRKIPRYGAELLVTSSALIYTEYFYLCLHLIFST